MEKEDNVGIKTKYISLLKIKFLHFTDIKRKPKNMQIFSDLKTLFSHF